MAHPKPAANDGARDAQALEKAKAELSHTYERSFQTARDSGLDETDAQKIASVWLDVDAWHKVRKDQRSS